MRKNGRSFREDIVLVIKGVRAFEKLLPGQMFLAAVKNVLKAGLPYVAVILSACMVNELAGNRDRGRLLLYVVLTVGISFLLYLLQIYVEARIAIGYNQLFGRHEMLLTDKAYDLPYEMLESEKIRKLREEVSGSINVSGAGMASLYWDMEVVFSNLCSVLISFILCMGFIKSILQGSSEPVEAIGIILFMILLVAVCSVISCRMTSKRFDVAFEVFEKGAKYKRYGEFYTLEYLSDEDAAMDVRIFQQADLIIKESWERCYEHFAKGTEKELRAVNCFDGVKLLCSCFCGAAVYILVGARVLEGSIGIGNVVMVHAAVTGMILALSEFAQIITDLRNNNEHLERFFAYMDLPVEQEGCQVKGCERDARSGQKQEAEQLKLKEEVQQLCLKQVSFCYPDSEDWVLKDINLTIQAGEKLALVGHNGSGKSTLIKLLCRLYRPTEGTISLNGRDIWDYSYEEYRKLLSAVFQDFALFAFSLGENVAASGAYREADVRAALEKAGLGEKLRGLPKGLKQPLSHDFEEDGVNLSGGEAQKAAIARALYKDAPIMILDEPTAALDPYAEYEIYQMFHQMSEGKTLLSISHRLSSCRMCDRIVVLESGKLIEEGSHEELLAGRGKYYEMWQAQARYYEK